MTKEAEPRVPVASSLFAPATTEPQAPQALPPDSVAVILYDQNNNPGTNSTVSQQFEAANAAFNAQGADDFTVPAGVNWTIQQVNVTGIYFNGPGPATAVNVTFYRDASTLPGTAVAGGTYTNLPITSGAATGSFNIALPSSLVLSPGTYWVSVQAIMNFTPAGEWGWTDRSVISTSGSAWQNPGGGFGTTCATWGRKTTCIATSQGDFLFQILGTSAPSVTCPPPTIRGTFGSGSPDYPSTSGLQTNRLFRSGVASTCGAPNACSTLAGTFHYDAYTFTNSTTSPQCVTTTINGCPTPNFIFAGAYLNSFDPANICTNNIGDPGLSPNGGPVTMAYTVPAGATFVVVISEVTANASVGCTYTIQNSLNFCGTIAANCNTYSTTTSTGAAIVPGTVDVGNHCDDCVTAITFPFPVTLYGGSFTTANVSSNGNMQFGGTSIYLGTSCPLPDSALGEAIMPYQGDLRTDQTNNGIFTSVTGTAPNRIFNVEWRTSYFGRAGNANFEVRFFESMPSLPGFDIIYGATADNGASEESGVQQSSTGPATTFSCNVATLVSGLKVAYRCAGIPVPTLAVSRKTHAGAGTFDIPLPLTGTAGVECRRGGGPSFDTHQVVVTFPNPVSVGGVTVTSSNGLATATQTTSGAVVTISLAAVADQQTLMITLTGVTDGVNTGNVTIPMGILLGDTNGDRFVNTGDSQQTRNRSGLAADATNFRSDVNTDGVINSGDSTIIRGNSGHFLP